MGKDITIDYSKLKNLDMIVCAGKSPFSTVTRRVTAGRRNMFNYSPRSHDFVSLDLRQSKQVGDNAGFVLLNNTLALSGGRKSRNFLA